MRAKLEQLPAKNNTRTFLCYQVNQPLFEFYWHYHPEYELTYIVSGKGKRLVGNNAEIFSDGDFVLLGPGIPHTWISEKNIKHSCKAIVIQFSKEFIEPLLQYVELKEIKKLLAKSEKGIQFQTKKSHEITNMLKQIVGLSDADSFIQLIYILQKLSTVKTISLNTTSFKPLKGNFSEKRINKVLHYVQNGFQQKITLKKAASIIHLSESAFCKYFKKLNGKTFSDYVNEIRIAHACKLLIETDKPISQIAFDSGFESLTYFNRVFLKKKKKNPHKFRVLL